MQNISEVQLACPAPWEAGEGLRDWPYAQKQTFLRNIPYPDSPAPDLLPSLGAKKLTALGQEPGGPTVLISPVGGAFLLVLACLPTRPCVGFCNGKEPLALSRFHILPSLMTSLPKILPWQLDFQWQLRAFSPLFPIH